MSNYSQVKLPREARNALRAAITNAPGWNSWRAANMAEPDGTVRDASTMGRADLFAAADALGVDVLDLLARYEGTGAASVTLTEPAEADAAPLAAKLDAPAADLTGKAVEELIREALAPAEGMVGPRLLDMLAQSVAPLAAAASQGPRIVEKIVTKTVNVAGPAGAAGDDAAPSVRPCNIVKHVNGRDLFGLSKTDCGHWHVPLNSSISVWDGTEAEGVPARDPFHVWDAEALAYMGIASAYADQSDPLRNLSRVLLFGPAGTGKTSSVAQFAAMTGRPFVRIAFDRTTEPAELIGQRMPRAGGGTEFRQGALVQAMQTPGCVILLDEPSFLRPGAAAVLQTILDVGAIYLKEDGNRRVQLAPGVIICAADNTALTGDETGRYCDTQTQNIALQDRFAWIVQCDYLSEAREASVLHHRTGIARDAASAMVAFAATTRKNAATGQLTAGVSLRRLMAWAVAVEAGVPSAHAFKASILSGTDAADRETIRGLEKNMAPHASIDAAAHGLPAPVAAPDLPPLPMTPQGERAAAAFGAVHSA